MPERAGAAGRPPANDVLGFHTERYRAAFAACVEWFIDEATVQDGVRRVRYRGRDTRLLAVPTGIDAAAVETDAGSETARTIASDLRADHALGERVAVAVDRLDYTKGVPERLRAFERLWDRRPDLQGTVSLVQKCRRTRQGIADYRRYADEVEAVVARVNDRFGTGDWDPVVHLDGDLDRRRLAGLYRLGDVCVVSSLRDGLNLVAEEYAVATDDGALVLGEGAGHADVLGDDAVLVDPTDEAAFADALERALEMDHEERQRRLAGMDASVREHDVTAWMGAVFEAVRAAVPARSD